MPTKKPRRTAERILDVTLAMFNRFGEPNVSTSQLCAELGISPGNLFYHHPTRDALIQGLFERYRHDIEQVLLAPGALASPATPPMGVEHPALITLASMMQALSRAAWAYRFLFRDLNDLVSRQRTLEDEMPMMLRQQAAMLTALLKTLPWAMPAPTEHVLRLWVGPMLATLTGCMGLDGALDPRERLRQHEDQVVTRAVNRALGLIAPCLEETERHALSTHLSRGDQLGSDPWWLLESAS